MAKHRAQRSLRGIVPAVLGILLAATAAIASPAAGANSPTTFGQLTVVGQNSVEKFNCYFDVQRVDNANGVVTGTLQGNAFPATLLGYFNVAHNTVNCDLLDSAGNVVLANVNATADKPRVSTGTTSVTVPYLVGGYTLCGAATLVNNNGSSSTAVKCGHS